MLSRLKSSVKGVVQAIRGSSPSPAPARPAPPSAVVRPQVSPAVATAPRPVEVAKPVAPAAKPVEVAKPVEAKPVEVAKPVEQAKAVEAKPVVAAPKVEAKPVNGHASKPAVDASKPAPVEAKPAPVADAKPAPVEAKPEPAKVEPARTEPAKVEPPKAEPPKKPSLAALAAAAAKAPAPKPASAVSHDDDEDHDDGHGAPAVGRMVRADMSSTDRAAYIARAIANNRDPNAIKGGEGRNVADDGTAYWGPLDNESSRAKADGKVLTVDQFECISCGTCVEQTNRVFYLPIDGKATPIAQDGPMDLIEDAIEACPVTCIHWVQGEEAEEKGLATGVGQDWSEVIASLPVD